MRQIALIGVLALTACQQESSSTPANDRIVALESRVAALEREVAEVRRTASAKAIVAEEQPPTPSPAAKNMTHALVNTSFQNERERKYPSLRECEAAKNQLLEDWRADDEAKRAKGVIFTSRPTPSCIPI